MKIGEFAEQFRMKQGTIRYYVRKGLLNPLKKRTYYDYNQTCVDDMRTILELKKMQFSLDEIAQYMSFLRMDYSNIYSSKQERLKMFSQKIETVNQKIDDLRGIKKALSKHYEEIKKDFSDHVPQASNFDKIGVPIGFLQELACPDCEKKLEMDANRVVNNMVISGELKCKCGYRAQVKEGIITFEGVNEEEPADLTPEKLYQDGQLPPPFFKTAMTTLEWINTKLANELFKGKIIFNPCVQEGFISNLLVKQLVKQEDNFIYIGLDPHFAFLNRFKGCLSKNLGLPKIVLLAGKIEKAPLKKGTCDFLTLPFSRQADAANRGTFPFDTVVPLLKREGKWFEAFFCAEKQVAVTEAYQNIADNLCCSRIKETLQDFEEKEFVITGKILDKGQVSRFFKDDAPVTFYGFKGKKK